MRKRGGPITKISVFPTEISVTGLEIVPYEQVSPVTGMKKYKYACVSVEGERS